METKIEIRKANVQFDIPKDSKTLGKLLKNIKETERLIRQDKDFLNKIRNRKPEIELQTAKHETQPKPKKYERHALFTAAPSRIPRSGIVFKDIKLY